MPEKVMDLNRFIPPDHKATHVSKGGGDSVTWQCDQDFTVTALTPSNPFSRPTPIRAVPDRVDGIYRANSGPVENNAATGTYHTEFQLVAPAGLGDPDIIVDA